MEKALVHFPKCLLKCPYFSSEAWGALLSRFSLCTASTSKECFVALRFLRLISDFLLLFLFLKA